MFHEIITMVENATSDEERIKILRVYGSNAFQEFLICCYNPNIQFDVEIPIYRPSLDPEGLNYTNLAVEMSRMYLFIRNHPKRMNVNDNPEYNKSLTEIVEKLNTLENLIKSRTIETDPNFNYNWGLLEFINKSSMFAQSALNRVKSYEQSRIDISKEKQKQTLINILENIHAKEADLVCQMIRKNIDIKGVDAALIKKAFPNIPIPVNEEMPV